MKKWLVGGLAACLFALRFISFAQEATGPLIRAWTSASGSTLEAEFVKLEFENVVLKKADGKTVKIRMNQLSSADQIWARANANGAAAGTAHPVEKTVPPALEELFGTKLIDAKRDKHSVADLADKKAIGVYFSAHWCPPCKAFTPQLVEFYNELKANKENFELVFVSSDKDEGAMHDYMKGMKMPWLAVPYGSKVSEQLKERFGISGIPTLIIVDSKGKTLSSHGCNEVMQFGAKAYEKW